MTEIQNICAEFSKGNFPAAYDHFAADIQWKIVGDKIVRGKELMAAFCDKMLQEMEGSILSNTNVIIQDNHIAIEGNCNYTNENNEPAQVEYCDVYLCDQEKIKSITSYCISSITKYETI